MKQPQWIRIIFLLIFLQCNSLVLQAQGRWQSFRELSRPERYWVLTHPFSAGIALEISRHVQAVADSLKECTLLDGDSRGGQLDALRHGYWMALLSQELNHRKAWRLGYDHEKGNKLYQKKQQGPGDRTLPTAADCRMDLFNNDVGIGIGRNHPHASRDELLRLVLEKILEGEFLILKKDAQGKLLDCQGAPVEGYTGQWDIPACLVPSNYRSP
jgi:hypothetical protein